MKPTFTFPDSTPSIPLAEALADHYAAGYVEGAAKALQLAEAIYQVMPAPASPCPAASTP